MNKKASWGLIGFGNIGHEVVRQIAQPVVASRLGLEAMPLYIVTSSSILASDGLTSTKYTSFTDIPQYADVNFVALPSTDDGKVALNYIQPLLEAGKLVITAEKGALTNHFEILKITSGNFRRFGVSATVGGGTRLLHVAREYGQDIDNITQIHLALNGTLAAIMNWVAPISGDGISLAQAAEKAVACGYAEPGSTSPAEIIRTEAEGDIPKKLAIFFNVLELGSQPLDWHTLRFTLTDKQIEAAVTPGAARRFIVSLYSPSYVNENPTALPDDIIGGFNVSHDGWRLMGGFRNIDADPLFRPLALPGPGNGIVIELGPNASDGVYTVTGPGAGLNPTVNAMIDDFVRLKKLVGEQQ